MIVVAGFNSAVDRLIEIPTLRAGEVQRGRLTAVRPGGKGVHVAQTIAALGEAVHLVGLNDAAGAAMFDRHMRARGVLFHGVRASTPLRQCMAIVEEDGRTTEVLEEGADVGQAVRDALDVTLRETALQADAVVCTGSLPPGFAPDYYAGLAIHLKVPCLIDASGSALQAAADASPFLLKPNRDEASHLAGYAVDSPARAAALVRELLARGVKHPVVTLGGLGAVGAEDGEMWHASLNVDGVRHAVGSGDCFLAGLTVGLLRGEGMARALRLAVACGAANALNDETGFVRIDTVRGLQPQVRVRRLDE
jgi:tagatose 6-phosphate kinase